MWRSNTRATGIAPIPVPTGPVAPVANPNCQNQALLTTNKDLATWCACINSMNATVDAVNGYLSLVEEYNIQVDAYNANTDYENCKSNGICLGNYIQYQSDFDDNFKNQKKLWTTCYPDVNNNRGDGATRICVESHGSGWVSNLDYQNCKLNSSPPDLTTGVGLTTNCQRTPEQALAEWKIYFGNKVPDPYIPTVAPQPPQFDFTNAITCCSQSFTNIQATNAVKIHDITQTCSATINNTIQQAADGTLPAGTTPPNATPPDTTAPAGLQTFAIVLIGVAVLVFIAMMIWVGVRLRKRSQKAKTPTPPAPPS